MMKFRIDGRLRASAAAKLAKSDRSWTAHFVKTGAKWSAGEAGAELRKRHGLQGPVDDAFLEELSCKVQPLIPLTPNVTQGNVVVKTG